MRFYEWLNSAIGNYDIFVAMDEREAKKVISILGRRCKNLFTTWSVLLFLKYKEKSNCAITFSVAGLNLRYRLALYKYHLNTFSTKRQQKNRLRIFEKWFMCYNAN